MKKITAVILLCVILFSFVSCAEEEEIVPEYIVEEPQVGYHGIDIKFASDYSPTSLTVFGYDRTTVFSDLALARIREVEEKYDCEIIPVESADVSELSRSAMTDTYFCDVMKTASFDLGPLMRAGLLLPVTSFDDYIDYTDADLWGNKNQLESLIWNRNLYGIVPNSWPEYFYKSCDFAFFVNEEMLRTIGEPDPREFVEDGTWTRNRLAEVVNNYTKTEGTDKTYGLSLFVNHFFDIALRADGIEFAIKGPNGWESGLHTKESEDTISWASDFLYKDNRDCILTQETTAAIRSFIEGRSAMVLTHLGFALASSGSETSIVYHMNDFGILPFPLGPNKPYGEWVSQHESMDNCIVFPISAKEPDVAAFLISEIFKPLPGFETQEALIEFYSQYTFHDERDARLVFKMLENCRYTFYADGARVIVDSVASGNAAKSVSEILEAKKDSYEDLMNEYIVPVYEAKAYLWGED